MENKEFILGELTFIEITSITPYKHKQCKYRCFCGETFIALMINVNSGKTKSCGCYRKDKARKLQFKDGRTIKFKNIINVHSLMIRRCYRPKSTSYINYGGRGITVCESWHSIESFISWAINNGYRKGLSIDRINNDGNYEPANCRWVNQNIQNINQKKR